MPQIAIAHCLAAGERAVFQPRSATFQQEVGEDIRAVLEAALLQVQFRAISAGHALAFLQHACLGRTDCRCCMWLTLPSPLARESTPAHVSPQRSCLTRGDWQVSTHPLL